MENLDPLLNPDAIPSGNIKAGITGNRKLRKLETGKMREGKIPVRKKARSLRRIRDELIKMDQSRAEKIESLRNAVQSGEYDVPGEKIAEHMINEVIVPPTPRI